MEKHNSSVLEENNRSLEQGLKQIAIFLHDFTYTDDTFEKDGLAEYEVVTFLYSHLDLFKHDHNFDNEFKSKAATYRVWDIISRDFSLQRMLIRRLEVIRDTGTLIPDEYLIKRNLFHKEESHYIGWVDTTQK